MNDPTRDDGLADLRAAIAEMRARPPVAPWLAPVVSIVGVPRVIHLDAFGRRHWPTLSLGAQIWPGDWGLDRARLRWGTAAVFNNPTTPPAEGTNTQTGEPSVTPQP